MYAVCEIIFETWDDTVSGLDKVCVDKSGVVWTLCKKLLYVLAFILFCTNVNTP